MNPLLCMLIIGVVVDIMNIYLYLLFIVHLCTRRRHVQRYIPSAVPFASLPIYLLAIFFTVLAHLASKKPLFPLGIEIKLGFIFLCVHIVVHCLLIFIIRLLSKQPHENLP